jgi:SMI1 / KNR4 family (SUKH-1)
MSLRDEVRRLATIVPREPGTALPPGASDLQIEDFSLTWGVPIPPEVREWLRFTDGPRIGPGGVYGLRDFQEAYSFLPEFQDRRWLSLGTDGCGDYYVLALDSEDRPLRPVYFIDPYQEGGYSAPTYAVASEFWRFLWFLFQDELGERRWPFDAEFVLANDPALKDVKSALLPWIANERSRA